MRTTATCLSSKSQITVPAWVRKTLQIEPKMKIVWIELNPGEISVVAQSIQTKDAQKNNSHTASVSALCGILKGKGNDDVDLVQSLLDDRKNDLTLEERGFHN